MKRVRNIEKRIKNVLLNSEIINNPELYRTVDGIIDEDSYNDMIEELLNQLIIEIDKKTSR